MADIGNPILFGDLFDKTGIEGGLQGLIDKVGEVENSLLSMVSKVKKEASSLGEALSGTSSASKGDRDATTQYAAKIEELHSANEKLQKSLNAVQKQLDNMKRAKNKDKGETDALLTSYASLQDLLKRTKVNLDDLGLSEKARIQIAKNGQIANNSLGGSYNQLYAQYNLVKTALNAMTDSMRNSEKVGKVWEAEALRLMDIMKAMQEATGKHTLSVGDYTKAFNGLSISTQQVLRELPTLANSWSQFFIAISNNVPIFVDNLKRVKDETGSWKVAMKGVLTSVFSWQTALLVVLTILPKVAKAIHDKKKANEEEAEAQAKAAKEAEKATEAYKSLLDIYNEIARSAVSSVTELKVLSKILDDANTSWEDRIDAGKRLKQVFEDELAGFSAEEIAIGKAKRQMQDLTKLIYEQARARSTLNQITKLTEKYLELEEQAKLYENFRYGTRTVKEYAEMVEEAERAQKHIHLGAMEQEAVDKYRSIVSQMRGYQNQINKLIAQIQPKFLLDDEKITDMGDKILKIPDYYNDALQGIINLMEEGLQKELAQLDLNYKIQQEKNHENEQALLESRKKANKEELGLIDAQLSNLRLLMSAAELDYYAERERLIKAHLDTYKEVVGDEDDYDELARQRIRTRLEVDMKLRNATIYKEYENEKMSKDALNKAILASEKEYWETYLMQLRQEGLLTVDEYNKIMANLSKGVETTEKTHQRNRKRYRNLIEAAFAQTYTFGERGADGVRKVKDEYIEFADAVNTALSEAMGYMDEWMDKRIEMAEIAVEAAQKETEAAKTALDYEMEARANGYANNVELARKEYEEKLQLERDAIAEKERLQKIQESIDAATQLSSLITATANLLAGYSGIPLVGQILAAAAIAAMWGTFAAAKITAAQMTATKYGEGMSEYLDYGGSHASGNDIDFGADKNGRRRRVERGEMIGVINKRNVEKYGVSRITDIIQSLNKGTFENKYSPASQTEAIQQLIMRESILRSVGLSRDTNIAESINRSVFDEKYGLAFSGSEDYGTDLSAVERGIQTLVEQGETKVVTTPYGRIEYKGNNKRIIRNS